MAEGGSGIYLPVMASARGMRDQLVGEATQAARDASRTFTQQFGSGARNAGRDAGRDLAAGLRSAQSDVAKASQALTRSRDAELTTSAALTRAERNYQQASSASATADARATAASQKVAGARAAQANAISQFGAESQEAANATRELERATTELARAQQQAQTASNRAADQLDRQAQAQRRQAQAMEQTETAARGLRGAEEQAAQAQNDLDQASQRTTGSMSRLSSVGKLALTGLAAGAGAAALAIGTGISNAIEQANIGSSIAAKLGDTSGAAEYGKTVGRVFATTVGSSMEQASTAVDAVASTFGRVGDIGQDELQKISTMATNFSTVMGTDVSEAVQTASNLMVNGLAKDGTEAFDLLTRSYQQVPEAMRSELPEILNEYSTHFRSLGFDGQRTFEVMTQAANAGKWALDKAGDAVKEFSIRATDGSKSTTAAYDTIGLDARQMAIDIASGGDAAQAATQKTIAGLLGIQDPADRAQTAIALFGTPMEDLAIDKIPTFLQSLQTGNKAMDGFAGSTQRMTDQVNSGPTAALELFQKKIQQGIVEGLGIAAQKLLEFGGWVRDNIGILGTFAGVIGTVTLAWVAYNTQQKLAVYGGLVNYLRLMAVQMYGMAAATWASNAAFLASPITWVVLGIAALVAAFVLLWNNVEGFRNFWKGAWDGIKTAFSAVWNWIKDAFNGLKDIFLKGDFTGALARAFGIEEDSPVVGFLLGLRETAIGVWNAIVAGAQFLWSGLQTIFGALVSFWQGVLFPVLSFLWSSILQPVFTAVMAGAQMLWSVISFVFNAWVTMWTGVVFPILRFLWNQVLSPVFSAVQTGVGVLWTVVKGVFSAWIGFYTGVLFPILRFLWDSVISPIFGFIGNLISSVWSGVIWPALSAFGNFIKDILGPVFSWLWNDIIKPAWDGIGTAITFVIDNVVKPAFEGLKTALGAVGDFFGTVVEGIKIAWNKLKEYAAKPINFVIENVWNNGLAKGWNKIADFIPGLVRASPLQPVAFRDGGAVWGAGSSTNDKIPAVLSNNEHVLDAMDVSKMGGQGVVYAMRSLLNRGAAFSWDTVRGLRALPSRSLQAIGSAPASVDGKPAPIEGFMPNVPVIPAFRDGGAVDTARLERPAWELQLENGHRAAKMRNGNPYTWGNEDCSGYMSMIADAIINGGNGVRKWATGSFPGGQPFVPGLGRGFSVGVHDNPGGPGGGHTAGTLSGVGSYATVNVESGGSHGNVAYGGPAVGADNAQWDGKNPGRFHLAIGPDGAFESGGAGGGAAGPSPSEQKGFIKNKVKDILNKFMNPAKSAMVGAIGSPPPEWLAIPPKVYDNSLNGAVDGAFKIADGLTSNLRTVYDAASSVADSVGGVVSSGVGAVTGLFRDQGGVLPTGTSLVVNKTGKKEWILNDEQWKQVQALMSGPAKLSKDDAVKKVMTSAPAGTADNTKPTTNGTSPGQSSYDEQTARAPEKAGAANAGGNAIDFGGDLLNQGVDALAGWAEKGVSAGITAGMTGAGIPGGGIAGELAGKGAEAAGKWAGHGVKTAVNIAKGVTKDVAGFFGFGYDEFTDPFGAFKSVIGNVQGAESANQQTTTDPSAKTGAQSLAEESINTESSSSKATDANQGAAVKEVLTPEVEAARKANPDRLAVLQQVKARGGSKKDALTTLMVEQAESGGKNLASAKVAESLNFANDGVAPGDHDSVGRFQQRASWGSVADRMDPRKSTDLFLNQLLAQKDRETRSNAEVAQAVQRSAFADGSNYAKHQEEMQKLLNSLGVYDTGGVLPSGGLAMNTSGHDEYVVPPKAWGKLDDVLQGGPDGSGNWDAAMMKELGRLTEETDAKGSGGHGGPLIQIDKIEANDPTEAASALSKEARRLGRSNSLIGGR